MLVTGRLVFAPGETEKTFPVLINEDNYTEGDEFATLVLMQYRILYQRPRNGAHA